MGINAGCLNMYEKKKKKKEYTIPVLLELIERRVKKRLKEYTCGFYFDSTI